MTIALIAFILMLVVALGSLANSGLLLNAEKKQLQKKFEAWWLTVQYYDKIKLAVAFAGKTIEFLDYIFGKKTLSWKLVFRSSLIGSLLFASALAMLGVFKKETFGLTPWLNYNASMKFILDVTDDLSSTNAVTELREFSSRKLISNHYKPTNDEFIISDGPDKRVLFIKSTNGMYQVSEAFPLNTNYTQFGFVYRTYEVDNETNKYTNSLGEVSISHDPYEGICNDVRSFRHAIAKYNTKASEIEYSVIYFIVIFLVNAFLFTMSVLFCRIMLNEVEKAARIFSTVALVFMNFSIIGVACAMLTLFFTIVAIPVFWLLIPLLKNISTESTPVLFPMMFSAGISLWFKACGAARFVTMVAFIPLLLSFAVGFFSLWAIKYKNHFFNLVSRILALCEEQNPITVILAISGFILAVLTAITYAVSHI